MTLEEKKRLGTLIGLLNSNQVGEREAALGKIHALRSTVAWPGFVDLWQRAENAVSPEDFEKVEKNLAQWQQAHGAEVAKSAVLRAEIKTLRAALWSWRNLRSLATACLVLAFIAGGGWYWWDAQAAQQRVQSDPAQAATNAAMRDVLERMRWGTGDTAPIMIKVGGAPYWVITRGTVDAASHADARGQLIERHCLQLFASEAVPDSGAFVTPEPYLAFGWLMQWPQRAAECRMPGTRNY